MLLLYTTSIIYNIRINCLIISIILIKYKFKICVPHIERLY